MRPNTASSRATPGDPGQGRPGGHDDVVLEEPPVRPRSSVPSSASPSASGSLAVGRTRHPPVSLGRGPSVATASASARRAAAEAPSSATSPRTSATGPGRGGRGAARPAGRPAAGAGLVGRASLRFAPSGTARARAVAAGAAVDVAAVRSERRARARCAAPAAEGRASGPLAGLATAVGPGAGPGRALATAATSHLVEGEPQGLHLGHQALDLTRRRCPAPWDDAPVVEQLDGPGDRLVQAGVEQAQPVDGVGDHRLHALGAGDLGLQGLGGLGQAAPAAHGSSAWSSTGPAPGRAPSRSTRWRAATRVLPCWAIRQTRSTPSSSRPPIWAGGRGAGRPWTPPPRRSGGGHRWRRHTNRRQGSCTANGSGLSARAFGAPPTAPARRRPRPRRRHTGQDADRAGRGGRWPRSPPRRPPPRQRRWSWAAVTARATGGDQNRSRKLSRATRRLEVAHHGGEHLGDGSGSLAS